MRSPWIAAVAALLAACSGDDGSPPGDDPDGAPRPIDAAPPDAYAGTCGPTAGGPRWLEEGETVTATVSCLTGEEPGDDGFVVTGLPPGAAYDADSRTISFTPGLDQAAVYRVGLSAPSIGEDGELVIGVADKFDDPDNVPVVDPAAYPEEYGVPVIFVAAKPTSSSAYQPVTVVYGGRTYDVLGKLRGASSLSYPKQSFTLNFAGDHFEDAARGFVDKKKIVLTTTFDDNSGLRARLTWELWNALAPAVPVTVYHVVLYLDGAYHGVYVMTDHIDDELMDQRGLPEAGNLYKAIDHNANFKDKGNLHAGYEKKHGEPAGDFDDLEELVDFVANADDAAFGAELEERVHLPDFEAWWLLATFLKLSDSAGKNSYLHHSTITPWHVVPWDFNDSLGQNWYTLRAAASPVDTYASYNRLFQRLMTHADFAPGLAARYAAELSTGGAFDLPAILARIDALADELGPAIARDDRRWRAQYLTFSRWSSRTDFLTSSGEIAYVKDWLDDRWATLRASYPSP